MANQFNVDQLRLQIETLLRDYPDLAEDDLLRTDMLAGATDMHETLAALFETSTNTKMAISSITLRLKQMGERRTRLSHRVDFLRGLMLQIMQAADLKKLELPEATLSQRHGVPRIVGAIDVNALPADLCRVTVEPNMTAIREALAAGVDLPGLSLGNAPPSLQVNVK